MASNESITVVLEEPLRVLIIDDDLSAQRRIQKVFEATHLLLDYRFAKNYNDALSLLLGEYFDIGVVDLIMHEGDPGPHQEWEGFDLLQEVLDRGFHRDIALFINSYFVDYKGVARDAFKVFRVKDMWSKELDQSQIVQSLQTALRNEMYFGLRCKITFDDGLNWDVLAENLKLPLHILSSALSLEQASLELRHLIRRLFPDAISVHVAAMEKGASGSAVLRATPFHEAGEASSVVVKYGPLANVRREYDGWCRLRGYTSGFRMTQINDVNGNPGLMQGRHLAALTYTLVGAQMTDIVSFAKCYLTSSAADIERVLERLFLETCRLWYKNMEISQDCNIGAEYAAYLGVNQKSLETPYLFKYPEWPLDGSDIQFQGLPRRKMNNPVYHYCTGKADFRCDVGMCLTHGDFHGSNIRVSPETHDSWLIDFGRSGKGVWVRDFVQLETVIKFQLMQSADVPALYELEDALASGDSLDTLGNFSKDEYPDLQKAFRCIASIRRMAARASKLPEKQLPPEVAYLNYLMSLFYQTLNYIRLQRLIRGGQKKNHVLISAAIILERVNALMS